MENTVLFNETSGLWYTVTNGFLFEYIQKQRRKSLFWYEHVYFVELIQTGNQVGPEVMKVLTNKTVPFPICIRFRLRMRSEIARGS